MVAEPIQRCARVNFKPARVVRDGVAYVGFVSTERTQVNNAGGCKRICGDLVLDPGRGVLGVMIRSDGKLCYGGFANVEGKVTGALRGVLAGHIVIWFSATDCDPTGWDLAARGRDCTVPPAAPHSLCHDRPVPPGWQCIYCVLEQEAYRIGCTFVTDATVRPCDAYSGPGGTAVLPVGVTVRPSPGMYDIYGDAEAFCANDGRTGLVKYYLQSGFGGTYDPLWIPEGYEDFCHRCRNWVCFFKKHYLGSGELNDGPAWGMVCTKVLPREDDDGEEYPQACCYPPFPGQWDCTDVRSLSECDQLHGTLMGPGTSCDLIPTCDDWWLLYGACCLPNGDCVNTDEETCRDYFGGLYLGRMLNCGEVGNQCQSGADPNLAARDVLLTFQDPIGVVEFDLSSLGKGCFRLADNFCLTSGPELDCAGQPCWAHVGHGNIRQLQVLDRIDVDFSDDFGWAAPSEGGEDRYPHAEPAYVRIVNAAFGLLDGLVGDVNNHPRQSSFDRNSLNHWWEQRIYDCLEAPAVPGADGQPWPIYVVPYRTQCAYPADLVVRYVNVELWLSGDPGNTDFYGNTDDLWKIRVLAKLKVRMELDVRLRPGWEQLDCPVRMAADLADRCSPEFEDPDYLMLFTGEGVTRIPRELHWVGLQGPRPWSRGPFDYEQEARVYGLPCCTFICAIDGLVIPAEVDDTGDPDAGQRYAGDVVLLNQEGRALCDCVS